MPAKTELIMLMTVAKTELIIFMTVNGFVAAIDYIVVLVAVIDIVDHMHYDAPYHYDIRQLAASSRRQNGDALKATGQRWHRSNCATGKHQRCAPKRPT